MKSPHLLFLISQPDRKIRWLTILLNVLAIPLVWGETAEAQLAADGTIGTQVNLAGQVYTITGGAITGNNLFHSFEQFSVPTSGTARFDNATSIQHIFSRVTGNAASQIDGRIQVNGTANLFLINPNGIVLGSGARLDLRGSFLATTGDRILFADGSQFSANPATSSPLLTMTAPVGVQFGSAPGAIQVQRSVLQLSTATTLGLLGGDVTLEGSVLIVPGRVELGSVAANAQVGLSLIDRGFALDYAGVTQFRDILLSQRDLVNPSGNGGDIQVQGDRVSLTDGSVLFANTRTAESGRKITINARQLTLKDGSIVSASTLGAGQAGDVEINATEMVELVGANATETLFSSVFARTEAGTTGRGGNILINTRRLIVQDGAQISASARSSGAGGNIVINATESVRLTGTFRLTDGREVQSGLFTQVNEGASGTGGSLTINTGNLTLESGAIVTARTRSRGEGGSLIVNASESIQVLGRSVANQLPSSLSAGATDQGAAGALTIVTPKLTVSNGAEVSVSGTSTGAAGNLQISAQTIRLLNQGTLTAETQAGQGNITLNTDTIQLRQGSRITTNATGSAPGGNITLRTGTLVAIPQENSDITANAQDSVGGRVIVQAEGVFGTQFRSQATPASDITATSKLGPQFSGTVTIQTPDVDPSRGLVDLEPQVVDPSSLVVQGCAPRQQRSSEFIVTGRGGLPPSPSEALINEPVLADLGKPLSGDRQPENRQPENRRPENRQLDDRSPNLLVAKGTAIVPVIQAQGWVVNAAGKVVLLAEPTIATPTTPGFVLAACPAVKSASGQ
jgi:filamentous hemagglutinin family protein